MTQPVRIGKLDAARRQLETAISLWFTDGDVVSLHTLAFAAYEIIHAVSKKRDPNRDHLLLDTPVIKDEYRKEFTVFVKRHANFFKHADRDAEAVAEFHPILSDLYILFSIKGLEICGERLRSAECAFTWWHYLHKPEWLTEAGRTMIGQNIRTHQLAQMRSIPKAEFLKALSCCAGTVGIGLIAALRFNRPLARE